MDTAPGTAKLAEGERRDQFIPVRKEDLFSTLIKQGDLADPVERELFGVLRARCAQSVTTNIRRRSIGCAMITTILIPRSQATLRQIAQRGIAPMTISSDRWIKFSKMQILRSCRTKRSQKPTANAQSRSKSRQSTTISARYAFTSAAAMSSGLK